MEQQWLHQCEQMDRLMQESAANRAEHASFRRRLDALEEGGKKQNEILLTLQRQADAIVTMGEKIEALAGGMRGVVDRVAEMEREPGRRWKNMGFEIIKCIVLAAVGAAVGFMLK